MILFFLSQYFVLFSFESDFYFIQNSGLYSSDILFSGHGKNQNIWIDENSIIIDFFGFKSNQEYFDLTRKPDRTGVVEKFQFSNCRFKNIIFENELKSYNNYFLGRNSNSWIKHLKKYSSVLISEIRNGIDLKISFNSNGNIRYDLILKPGANPEDISIEAQYCDSISINPDGTLKSHYENININQTEFLAYQEINNFKTSIPASFNKNSDKSYGFNINQYDKTQNLIIDPIIFSSYLGGSSWDTAEGLVIDSSGNLIVVGYTSSNDFPTTRGAYNEKPIDSLGHDANVIISKFDSTGRNLIFSTYLGGKLDDFSKSIALDKKGDIYITGYTSSSLTFPLTPNTYDTTWNGGYDIFLCKLSTAGDSLIYSTYFGGKKDDYAQSIAVDTLGNAYIVGYTSSDSTFPVTKGAYDTIAKSGLEGFITKFNPTGSNLVYSTLIGGTSDDYCQDIIVDNFNIVYVTGFTNSRNFPTTQFAYDTTYNDADTLPHSGDIFFVKLNTKGNSLLYSTYLGGSGRDVAYGIAIDKYKNVYLTGMTESIDFPVIRRSYDTSYNDATVSSIPGDVFVTKLNYMGDSLLYSTYLGGSNTELAYDISVDTAGCAYITGYTTSNNYPTTPYAFSRHLKDTINGGSDAFLTKLNPSGSDILYSTYIGGSQSEVAKSLVLQKNLYVFLAGTTHSHDFPISQRAFDTTKLDTNSTDIFLMKFLPSFLVSDKKSLEDTFICLGNSIILKPLILGGIGKLKYDWTPKINLSNPDSSATFAQPDFTTMYYLTVTDQVGQTVQDSILITVFRIPNYYIYGNNVVFIGSRHYYYIPDMGNVLYSWSVEGGDIITGSGTNKIYVAWKDSTHGRIQLTVTNLAGCKDSTNYLNIIIGKIFTPEINYSGSLVICDGEQVTLDAGEGYLTYNWSDGATGRIHSISKAGQYWVTVTDSIGLQGTSDTLTLTIKPLPDKPEIRYFQKMLQCLSLAVSYQWYLDDFPIAGATTKNFSPIANGRYFIEIKDLNGCRNRSDTILIDLSSIHDKPITDSKLIIYPNPSDGEFILEYYNSNSIFITIEISDLLGNIIYKKNEILTDGIFRKKYILNELSGYSSGMYLIKIISNQGVITEKIGVVE